MLYLPQTTKYGMISVVKRKYKCVLPDERSGKCV